MNDFFDDIFLAFVRLHLLYRASVAPVCGAEFMEEWSHEGYHLSPGALYPIFRSMETNGYLLSERHLAGGIRQCYHITDAGRAALARLRPQIRDLAEGVSRPEAASSALKRTGEEYGA